MSVLLPFFLCKMCRPTKYSQSKSWELFFVVGSFRTSSPGDSISSNHERTALRRQGEESVYIEVGKKGQVVWISKISLWFKTRYLKLKNLVLFYVWGDARNHLQKWFLAYAPPLTGVSILCFSHLELPWGAAAVWWRLDCRYSPSWVPLWLRNSQQRAAIADDCDILVYWYCRKYFIS